MTRNFQFEVWPGSVAAIEVAYCSLLYSLWNFMDRKHSLRERPAPGHEGQVSDESVTRDWEVLH